MRVEVKPGYHIPTALRKKPFWPGEQFDVDDKEGRNLVLSGVVEEVKDKPSSSESGGQLNVTKTAALVAAAQSDEELDKLAEGETRKGVQTAIELRRKELAAASEQ